MPCKLKRPCKDWRERANVEECLLSIHKHICRVKSGRGGQGGKGSLQNGESRKQYSRRGHQDVIKDEGKGYGKGDVQWENVKKDK